MSSTEASLTRKQAKSALLSIGTPLRTVSAIFSYNRTGNSGHYAYFVPPGDEPKVGDVIMTSCSWDVYGKEHMIDNEYRQTTLDGKLAKIVEVHDHGFIHDKATKFYMHLFAIDVLKQRHESNRELIIRAREKKSARDQLETLLKEKHSLTLYKELAKHDPEAKRLLVILES